MSISQTEPCLIENDKRMAQISISAFRNVQYMLKDRGLAARTCTVARHKSFNSGKRQPEKKQTARGFVRSAPLVPHLSFTCPHTLSTAALSRLRNPITTPATVPDTQALLGNTTLWITCSRLPVSHTCTLAQWPASSRPFPDPISTGCT